MKLHLLGCSLVVLALMTDLHADHPAVDALPDRPALPDPLTFLDGSKVKTKEQWQRRRTELKGLFQHYMYGHFPPAPAKLGIEVLRVDKQALGGKATLKEVALTVAPGAPKIHVLLVLPNKRQGKVPMFAGLNFQGNHTVLDDPKIQLPTSWMPDRYAGVKNNRATDGGRGAQKDVWNVEAIIDRGYGLATAYCGDIDPDRKDKREGIQAAVEKALGKNYDWATIAAWAWGLQRIVDYLATEEDVDMGRIVVVGHSRLGKTALLASAFDDRVAIAMPHQAGCGGTAPSRGKIGESVQRINTSFPHWFNAEFKKFNGRPEKLPFDQHCLAALMAPRPVLFTNALEDQWANPSGQFEVLQAADPVYRLLGVEGLKAAKMPAIDVLSDGRLGYFIREGKHSMNRADWQVFLDYADKHLKAK